MDNEYDFEVPIQVGLSGVVLDLVMAALGKKTKDVHFEKVFNLNYLQGFKQKYEKWANVLEQDLLTKGNLEHSQVKSILSSNFVSLYFNKYLKEIYHLYFLMGFVRDTEMEEEVSRELIQPIESISNELLLHIKKNTSDEQLRTIYGPIFKNFIYDAHSDGTSYSAFTSLERLKKYKK